MIIAYIGFWWVLFILSDNVYKKHIQVMKDLNVTTGI